MLRAYTAAAVRAAEQPLLDDGRGPELMARAAHGLALGVRSVLRSRRCGVYGARVVLLVGSGNNGGDALFAGALLAAAGVRTTALLTHERTHPAALQSFEKAGGRTLRLAADGPLPGTSDVSTFLAEAAAADVMVDGLLGIGGRGGLRGPSADIVAQLCHIVRSGRGPAVVACDLPSGVDATTGEVHEPVLPADLTVTFGALKTGLLASPAERFAGVVKLVDLGIGHLLGKPDIFRLEATDVAGLLPRGSSTDHKYTRGVAGIVAGSARYPGAALLAVAAASACGPGMVRYLGPGEVATIIHARNPEAVCSQEQPETVRVQAWLAGPGIDGDARQLDRARQVLASGEPAVIDAGALGLLGSSTSLRPQLIITPHAGELARILARNGVTMSRTEIESAPLPTARKAAQLLGVTVLLKGSTSVVAAPDGTTFSQSDGTPQLATAGSGDTLAGILVGLLGQRASRWERLGAWLPDVSEDARWAAVAAVAVSLHGRLAGGMAPLNAGELAERIPAVWERLCSP